MGTDQTVFYLTPVNDFASQIITNPKNSNRACQFPKDPKKLCLRIGLDQESKIPPYLVSFGRQDHNDVILNRYFPTTDQCYFDFNKESGEILLHDISRDCDTQLKEIKKIKKINNEDEDENGDEEFKEELGIPLISVDRRQCVVLLQPDLYRGCVERQWLFQIHGALFRLIPGPAHSRSDSKLMKERLAFARNTNNNGTLELQQLDPRDLRPRGSLAREIHSSYFRTSPKHGENMIRFEKLKPLGGGNQGEVHEVIDMFTGTHYACKFVYVVKGATQWNNHTKDYRKRVKREVGMVRKLLHPHIVPFTHTQNSEFSPCIEIFMPVYEGDLKHLLQESREWGLEGVQAMIHQMLYQMLQALDFVHSQHPPIIHRDVKPPNILYRGGDFFLTDFGIAKAVDTSNTFTGTGPYMAPEVRENRQQTTKIDIWALGVTVVECLQEPKDFRKAKYTNGEQWYEYLQAILNQHKFLFASMVSVDTDGRPTARDLLQNWPTGATLSSGAPPLPPQPSGTTATNSSSPVLMDRAQTVSTTPVQPTTHDENLQLSQPVPAAIASLDVAPSPPAQPGARHGESVKSARPGIQMEKKGHKRKRSSYDGDAPSHSSLLPAPKRFCKA